MERALASITALGVEVRTIGPSKPPRRPISIPRLIVGGVDYLLRRAYGVVDIDPAEPCLLRISVAGAPRAIRLSGQTIVDRGDPVITLHFRNVDLPPVPDDGPDFAWVCRFRDQLSHAMRKLALRLESDPRLADVKAISARMSLASGGRSAKARRFGAYFGLEPADEHGPDSLGERVHDRLEDVWLWALAWAYNPVCLRGRDLARGRDEVWMSRADFIQRHRAAPARTRRRLQALQR